MHAREVGHLSQAVERDDALVQPLVARRQLASREDAHALVVVLLEQQAQDVTSHEPRRTGDERGAGHAVNATPRAVRP